MRCAVLSVSAALAGCGGAPLAPPPEALPPFAHLPTEPARPKLPDEPISAPPGMGGPRRVNLAATALDLASLPEMTPATLEAGAGFTLSHNEAMPDCEGGTQPRPYEGWGLAPSLPPRTVLDIEGFRVAPALLDGRYDDLPSALRQDGGSKGSAAWVTVTAASGRDALDVARYDATFNHAGWRAVATAKHSVRPAEIVPRALFAYRRCAGGCDRPPGDSARRDLVGVVGPRAVWASASDVEANLTRFDDVTVVELGLAPGASASFTLLYERADVDALHDPRPPPAVAVPEFVRYPWKRPEPREPIQVASVEIVWSDGQLPEATVYTGLTFARAEQIAPAPLSSPAPHCFDIVY